MQLAGCLACREMVLLQYLQSRDGLPDPSTILAQAIIAEANREGQEAISICRKRTERGSYKRYRTSVHAEIGKYASQISQDLLCLGSSKAEVRRRRGHCCSSLEKMWKTSTSWPRVGHQGAAVPKEGQRQWRSSVGPNCNGSCLGHFAEV